jgi:hypothetical protein
LIPIGLPTIGLPAIGLPAIGLPAIGLPAIGLLVVTNLITIAWAHDLSPLLFLSVVLVANQFQLLFVAFTET